MSLEGFRPSHRPDRSAFVARRNFAAHEPQKNTFSHKPPETPSVEQQTLGSGAIFVPQNGHRVSRADMVDIKPAKGPDGTHGVRITPLVWKPLTTVFGPSLGGGRSAEARHRARKKAHDNHHRS